MSLNDAMFSWNVEVEAEAARLINEGTAPFEAIVQARNAVSRRRKTAARAPLAETVKP